MEKCGIIKYNKKNYKKPVIEIKDAAVLMTSGQAGSFARKTTSRREKVLFSLFGDCVIIIMYYASE